MNRATFVLSALALVAAAAPPPLRYDDLQQKSAHNTYERDEALIDVLAFHRVRSIELDIHHSMGSTLPPDGDWLVYHADRAGNRRSTCKTLSSCLRILRGFHDTFPQHEVVTVFVDLKDAFRSSHRQTAEDFDARLELELPKESIETPAELLARCNGATTIREAVERCDWPAVDELRGRFFFVLTGDAKRLERYAKGADRRAFAAPEIAKASEIAEKKWAVFINLKASNRALAADVAKAGLVGRVYDLGEGTYRDAIRKGANHLGTNDVSYLEDPWSKTHNANGWPALCKVGDCSKRVEAGPTIVLESVSGDLWGKRDDFVFLAKPGGDGTWSALVSAPSSHTEDWAKGCLMARGSYDRGSPYFAVCRPADDHFTRIQVRKKAGADTSRTDVEPPSDYRDERHSPAFLRLVLSDRATCARAEASVDRRFWRPVGAKTCFAKPLALQGLATSSHGDRRRVKFLFSDVRQGTGAALGVKAFEKRDIGAVESSRAVDGVL